ncbi:extensin family protein [Lichenibacterium dinghuense]|uniref:extensin-like domain-containing protein n=1 Tax=Lichenibacterium dinghuense TaxID=2895977 RepID=UPI001F3926CD|nr:extensin family protein [Lichenibacterium sp. 6Y81]
MRDSASAVARPLALGVALALAAIHVPASAVPLPVPRPPGAAAPEAAVPRPEEDGPPAPPVPPPMPREAFGPPLPPTPPPPPAPPEPDLACGPLLASGAVVARAAAPVAGSGGCGIASPVTLEAVVLRDGRRVPLVPPALMRCDLARTIADWLRDDVVPATAAEGELLGVADAAAYACRPRNAIPGGRLSEHARGNAVDLLSFRFARRVVGLNGGDARGTIAALRSSACARFATVLGPGSDRYHEADLHLDLEHRRTGVRLCQWDLP